ncbi:MAG: hypothetical protein Q8L97_13510 [Nitrosomonas sp.]|uniref:hypothetical protein n=1 Tax=Nitrosomonas sp. TaxID=42353 RepID=UPI00272F4502|nr:hypothetical protein [Nitrosomonas sp.]MBK6957126.1 hypothetical protein [Nitrosomonas sp.]MDP1551151.1 hypothetical protein [Nitrosomonas sp.]MDP1934578.1 hypothetical protein [Nitrosomonas sp.]
MDSIKILLWMANAIQPIDIKKLKYWDEINGLSKTGRLTDQALIGLGDAPQKYCTNSLMVRSVLRFPTTSVFCLM